MSIPSNAKTTPYLIQATTAATYGAAPTDVVVQSASGDAAKLGDLLLWSDRPFEFSVGPDSGTASGTITFGPTDSSQRSVLDLSSSGALTTGLFTIGSNPYAALLNLSAAAPVWWQESGHVYSFDTDLTIEALASGGGPGVDLFVSVQTGILFQVAHRPTGVRFMVGSDVALTLGPLYGTFSKDLYPAQLKAVVGGIQIPQVGAMPGGGSGVLGEIRAVDDGASVYLAVKVGATTWKKTVAFS